jgi:hypothetical protein
VPRARRTLGAYRIPLETGLLIPSDKRCKPDISNNVGPVKSFLSAPLRSLRRVVFVVSFDLYASTTTARSQSFGRLQSDPYISSINTSTMITSSNSLCRERDAPSSARRSTSHHVRLRAVPRTNRTLTTANTHSHSSTSNTNEPPDGVPSLPWQCSGADASPNVRSDVSSLDERVPPLVLPPPARNATRSCLACGCSPIVACRHWSLHSESSPRSY